MIVGLGTDIVENDRIRETYQKFGDRFLKRIFSDDEIEYAQSHADPVPFLAARFAVKEAGIKALTYPGEVIDMKDIELAGKTFGKKELVFSGKAKEIADKKKATKVHVSISHSETVSMAVVILENDTVV